MQTQQAQQLAQGTLISGRYRVKGPLGRGGFATVYEVEHIHLASPFALKVLDLPLDPHASQTFSKRFLQEAQFAAKIRHPNVVQTTDFGLIEQTGQPFLIMEKLHGHDLDDELQQVGALETARALRLFDGCLAAIQRGHELGIVHKDLKPSNLFLVEPRTADERLIVLDYGIARAYTDPDAKLTHTQNIAGTPAYLAPEYIHHQHVSPALDVYQLGLIIAESLMGVHPVNADTAMAYLMKHCMGQLELSPALTQSALGPILLRAMHLEHSQRWPNAGELRQALAALDARALLASYALPATQIALRKSRSPQSDHMVAQTGQRELTSGVFDATQASPAMLPPAGDQPATTPGVVPASWSAPRSPEQTQPGGAPRTDPAQSVLAPLAPPPAAAAPPSKALVWVGVALVSCIVLASLGVGVALLVKPPGPSGADSPPAASGPALSASAPTREPASAPTTAPATQDPASTREAPTDHGSSAAPKPGQEQALGVPDAEAPDAKPRAPRELSAQELRPTLAALESSIKSACGKLQPAGTRSTYELSFRLNHGKVRMGIRTGSSMQVIQCASAQIERAKFPTGRSGSLLVSVELAGEPKPEPKPVIKPEPEPKVVEKVVDKKPVSSTPSIVTH